MQTFIRRSVRMSTPAQTLASRLLNRTPPPLSPSSVHDPTLIAQIDALNKAPISLRAALHLANDDINSAHELAQSNEGDVTCDYLHGILHRREGDYWNSKVCYDGDFFWL